MIKKSPNTIRGKLPAAAALALLLILWQLASSTGPVPGYMLPSPVDVALAFVRDWDLLWENALITLQEAFSV